MRKDWIGGIIWCSWRCVCLVRYVYVRLRWNLKLNLFKLGDVMLRLIFFLRWCEWIWRIGGKCKLSGICSSNGLFWYWFRMWLCMRVGICLGGWMSILLMVVLCLGSILICDIWLMWWWYSLMIIGSVLLKWIWWVVECICKSWKFWSIICMVFVIGLMKRLELIGKCWNEVFFFCCCDVDDFFWSVGYGVCVRLFGLFWDL